MSRLTLDDLKQRGLTIANANGLTDARPIAQPQAESKADYEAEKELDAACVKMFRALGLRSRTDGDITAGGPVAGWYIHLHDTKRNPVILDYLILWHKTGRYCEIELKSRSGKIRPIQKRILEHGGASYLCRTVDEARRAVLQARDGFDGVECET